MIRTSRPVNIQIPSSHYQTYDYAPVNGGDWSSTQSTYLLTPQSQVTYLSNTPSPLSYPSKISNGWTTDGGHISPISIYSQEELPAVHYVEPAFQYQVCPPQPSLQYNAYYQPAYTMSSASNTSEQDALNSWERDFDKVPCAETKARWSDELYRDHQSGRIPRQGRNTDNIRDWQTCTVLGADGKPDAKETAKSLIKTQERKADLAANASRHKLMPVPEKGPPRRQNKFICYRSLRSSQLAAHYTNFKQSQFSAITSVEWRLCDQDWWGQVAAEMEEFRRQKYMGQLDEKGNPVRRDSVDSQSSLFQHAGQLKHKSSKARFGKQSQSPPGHELRYSPYSHSERGGGVPMSRAYSFAAHSQVPRHVHLPHRNSDAGLLTEHARAQLAAMTPGQPTSVLVGRSGMPASEFPSMSVDPGTTALGMYTSSGSSPMTVTTACSSEYSIQNGSPTHTTQWRTDPFAAHAPTTTPHSSPPQIGPHSITPTSSNELGSPHNAHFSQNLLVPVSGNSSPYANPLVAAHSRNRTKELLETYTNADDYSVEGGVTVVNGPAPSFNNYAPTQGVQLAL